MQLIKNGVIVVDDWVHFEGEGDFPANKVIVSLDVWRTRRAELADRKVGLRLEPDQHPEEIRADLDKFDLIALAFPTFMDGRGYSYAKILRDRYGYAGEIRAVGDVMRDQLYYMQRCGFTAFEIKAGKDITDAVKGLSDFSVKYQVSADEPLPIYRRR